MASKKPSRSKYLKRTRTTPKEERVELGDRVRDKVSGFGGIVTSLTYWLNGCVRVGIEAEDLDNGKVRDSYSIDEAQVSILLKGAVTPYTAAATPGGPKPAAKAWPDRR